MISSHANPSVQPTELHVASQSNRIQQHLTQAALAQSASAAKHSQQMHRTDLVQLSPATSSVAGAQALAPSGYNASGQLTFPTASVAAAASPATAPDSAAAVASMVDAAFGSGTEPRHGADANPGKNQRHG